MSVRGTASSEALAKEDRVRASALALALTLISFSSKLTLTLTLSFMWYYSPASAAVALLCQPEFRVIGTKVGWRLSVLESYRYILSQLNRALSY
jgi:hypothetical protein